MSRKPSPHEQRAAAAARAKDHLLRAAAALLDPFEGDNLGYAIVWTGMALLEMARADAASRAHDFAVRFCEEAKRRAA